jgi:hypothetical protein
MIEYREAVELAADITDNAIAFLASGIKLKSPDYPVFVFNTLTHDRLDACELYLPREAASGYSLFDENGAEYPLGILSSEGDGAVKAVFTAKVPALGYSVFYLNPYLQSVAKTCVM